MTFSKLYKITFIFKSKINKQNKNTNTKQNNNSNINHLHEIKKNTDLTVKNSCKKIHIRYATILRYVYRQVKTSSN